MARPRRRRGVHATASSPLLSDALRKKIARRRVPSTWQPFHAYLEDLGLGARELAGKRVLDLGGGASDFAEQAAAHGALVTDLDALPRKKPHPGRVQGLFQELPFRDESFDLVVSHVAFPEYARTRAERLLGLYEAARVLKKGGRACFMPVSLRRRAWRERDFLALARAMRACGFKVAVTTRFGLRAVSIQKTARANLSRLRRVFFGEA